VLREPRQGVGEPRPILCSNLERFPKLAGETDEPIFDTGFRVTSRLDEPNEPIVSVPSLSALVRACHGVAVRRGNSTQDRLRLAPLGHSMHTA
jgi:hypothetical protein